MWELPWIKNKLMDAATDVETIQMPSITADYPFNNYNA